VGDGNYFTTSAVLCLPFALLAVLHCKKRWKRLIYAGFLGVSLLGVTVCASRGGFLALTAALLFLVARSPHRVRNLVLISVVLLPLALFLPTSPLRRLLRPSRIDASNSHSRIMAWKAGMRMIADHPVLGVGLGRFKPLMPQYADKGTTTDTIAHNTYIEVAAELGLPSLLVFLAIPFFSYRSLEKARQRAEIAGREFPYYAALGLQAGLVGYMVGAFFLSAEYQKLFWLAIMLSMCLPSLVRARRKRQGAVPDADVTSIPLFAESPQS
jgi:O-antigen ligase